MIYTASSICYRDEMKLHSTVVVIVCSLLVQLENIRHLNFQVIGTTKSTRIVANSFQGIMFLIYPLLGYLADVYLTRYRALKCGLMMVLGGSFYCTVYSIANTIAVDVFDSTVVENGKLQLSIVLLPAFILLVAGLGLFEA